MEFCISLLYVSFLHCYINTADIAMCGPTVKDFRPIYSMKMDVNACSPCTDVYKMLDRINNKNQCTNAKD